MGVSTASLSDAEVRPDRVEEQYRDWTVTCGPAASAATGACSMQQAVTDNATKAVVMRFVVEPAGQGAAPVASIIGPFGVDLAQGLDLSVDGGPVRDLAFRTCLQVGCIATLPLDDALSADLRRGTALVVSVWPSDNPTGTISLPVSLSGFGDALDRLQALSASQTP
ncbi:invasion associated locus B family protein [Neotabrizicola shimadae]|uniref:Invasion associated locus B family protein n=1 Tax=Neotabrizicola shimadae TaxID=2807096 RepID=A0A8G0ZX87_9RHOB|nr:invasion associated locus B family protein [Neotabrizicola shimadae]QYZ70380.1 invasion associated locus B family protein [Neotabrizicola shimadae]